MDFYSVVLSTETWPDRHAHLTLQDHDGVVEMMMLKCGRCSVQQC